MIFGKNFFFFNNQGGMFDKLGALRTFFTPIDLTDIEKTDKI